MKNKEIDCDWTDEVVCPYCGTEFLDSWEYEDEGEEYCEECNKEFAFQRNVIVGYSSQKMEQEG